MLLAAAATAAAAAVGVQMASWGRSGERVHQTIAACCALICRPLHRGGRRPTRYPRRFDGGYGGDVGPAIKKMIQNQKLAVGFGGAGVIDSPVGWVGTESGLPGGREIWSIGNKAPTASTWQPIACDTTLQIGKPSRAKHHPGNKAIALFDCQNVQLY